MNCIIVDDDEMSRALLEYLCLKIDGLKVAGLCSNGIQAIDILKKEKIDLVFLDIEMPDISGMDIVKNVEPLPHIVMVTSKEKYALEAFEYAVTDFLKKPVQLSRLIKAVDKVRNARTS